MNKRQKRGLLLLSVGLVLVLCALGIHLSQKQQDAAAGKSAALLLQQLDRKDLPIETTPEGDTQAADPALPEKKYMDYTLIGSISIPSVDIRLPVLDDWSEEMLKVAPCRYAGSISDGNMIIMGHNYRSHFTPLHNIKVGAEVEFENTAGRTFRFRVAKIEYLHRTQGEALPAAYPLTIFTCTPGGLDRIVVRCEAA
ncbi:MAG: sortase [Oscillospiraceae bacterium]|nr:sortase [Oscillospiraceae bacterium]